ncbi:LamG domain-containing protein [Pyrococcus kukulkanii]|uniref:LamG domain-containing protein n=1 Tax=Pyrococcus kukulkanii TaxID=1609559 RepID=A0ABV4T6H8_9EURY
MTLCYYQGVPTNVSITFNATYPKLVTGKIGNAFYGDGSGFGMTFTGFDWSKSQYTFAFWLKDDGVSTDTMQRYLYWAEELTIGQGWGDTLVVWVYSQTSGWWRVSASYTPGEWHFIVVEIDRSDPLNAVVNVYIDNNLVASKTGKADWDESETSIDIISKSYSLIKKTLDEVRVYYRLLSDDERKLLYLAGRKKLSEPANFRQIFSPLIDLTRDRATFYAGLEVSTSDPNGYVPVPESAVNMSITSAEKLKSDYTGVPFYYQGHYWYRADKIQFNLPIQFETVRESGGFSKEILLDDDQKTFVYEKEFKVINPTAARINVVYTVDPTALGFSVLQYPAFELDGIRMAEWRPQNSTSLKLIATDTLEPGEISTHWIKSIWTISKEELEFPAKLDDFREINSFEEARKLFENAAKGKADTWVKVIKIDSNADVSNVTILVPLKGVEEEDDVIEAVALTGSRETLQVEKLEDGKVVVKVPAEAFVSGHAEIKVLYNKETSWWKSILEKIRSLVAKIKSLVFGG